MALQPLLGLCYISSFLILCMVGSGVHPIFYAVVTWGFFSGGKAAGAWSWPLISN
jgi:hypothetical protein